MLKIKLSRTGKKNQAHYRIVVNEAKSKRDGKVTDILGYYIPYKSPAVVKIDTTKYASWIDKGAKPTETVSYLKSKVTDSQETQIVKAEKKKKTKKQKEAEAKAKSE